MVRPFWLSSAGRTLLLAAACNFVAQQAAAQGPPGVDAPLAGGRPTMRAVPTTRPPVLDGRLDEPEWENAVPAVGFIQASPAEGQPLTERTEVRLLFDREYLYIGAYCYDSDSAGIITNELTRDFNSQEGDAFGVAVDVLHNARNSFSFFTNPGSAKRDAQSLEDGRFTNVNWNGVWHVSSAVHADGWVAEIAIPFKTLGLRSQTIESIGINFKRRIRRKNEEGYWSAVPRRFTINYVSLAGSATGFGEVSGGGALRLKPYATVDMRSSGAPPADRAKIGIDAKYRLSTGVALDLTYNTDFSHVEADTQQVNLTRFSPFFPEKREFFLENSDIFAFGDVPGDRTQRSQETQLFYTRRIGLSDTGQPLPLLGGARLSGRTGPWSVGVLSIRQSNTQAVAANTFTVARVRRDLFRSSDAGLIVVSRDGAEPGDFNRAYGADLNMRAGRNWTANAFWAATTTPGLERENDQKKLSTQWDDGLINAQIVVADIEENFRPEVGFVPRTGIRNYQATTGIRTPPGPGLVREWDVHAKWIYVTDRENLTLTKDEHYAVAADFRDGSRIKVSHNPQFERLLAPFQLRPAIGIGTGDYAFDQFQLAYSSDRSKLFSASVNLTRGGFYDGEVTSASVGATLLVKPHLSAAFTYERNAVDLPAGQVRADLYILRGLYAFDPRIFVDALVQYNVETRRVLTSARLNFTYRPLSDLSIVINEDRTRAGFLPGLQPARALTVKYTRLLQF